MVLLLGFLFAAGIVSFAKLNASNFLPPGVRIEKIYDRTELMDATTSTVLHNMILGIVLIFFVQWLFLGDLRSAVIVATTIPFALFFAVTIFVLRGELANLLSVGAIDFGLVVDATVIMVENIFRHLRAGPADEALAPVGIARAAGLGGKLRTIFRAAVEVNRAIFLSAAIIIAGFVPLFTLSGVEGHISARWRRPMPTLSPAPPPSHTTAWARPATCFGPWPAT